jgi:meso-butanediol dehydrogenase/(S,S)-butanediol dehydrogenase/diacetyl reductase
MPEHKRASFDFSGKTVLVTGATSGLGEAIAETFASSGADLVLAGRDQQRGAGLRERLCALGRKVEFIPGDITDRAYCETLVDGAVSALGHLDIVVNSAGVAHHATVDETTDEQWQNTFDVNVNGMFYVCRAAIPKMRERGGVIVNIASDAALTGSRHLVAYCASKGAVLQMTRAMALDHGREGIRVVAICPGDVDTPMLRGEFRDLGLSLEEGLRQSAENVPLNRVCTPEEVADLVLYSASDSGRFMTGYPLVMDGGYRA